MVEVAESSLDQDRTIKLAIYARAGIAVYWIINLIDFQIEVHREPSGPMADPLYRQRRVYRGDEKLPLLIDGVEWRRLRPATCFPDFREVHLSQSVASPVRMENRP